MEPASEHTGYRHRFVINEDLQETPPNITYELPMAVYGRGVTNACDWRPACNVPWHWHNEFEINICQFGVEKIGYGEECLSVKPGEGIFINANTLHTVKNMEEESSHLCILFDASMLMSHPRSAINMRYMLPVSNCGSLPGIPLSPEVEWQSAIMDRCRSIEKAYCEKLFGYELVIQQQLSALWLTLIQNVAETLNASTQKKSSPDEDRIRQMMQYIHTHYQEELSLEDIAASASVSVSECCRCFKRVLSVTPFAYLIEYRLHAAARQILGTGKTISEIAHDAGFDTESYFSRKFRELYGNTPSQYRRNR